MNDDRGSMTLWLLGLALLVLGVGAIAVDLWRVLGERSELAALVDSAAVAATSALDESALRSDGMLLLVEGDARRRAATVLAADPPDRVVVSIDGSEVTVVGERVVPLTLLRLVVPDERPITVRAAAVAVPDVRP